MKFFDFIVKYTEVPDITLKMIVEAGIISPGTIVYAAIDRSIQGVINIDGSITLNIVNKNTTFSYPSGAARAITKTSVNGWIFWLIGDNGTFKDLTSFKKKYIEAQNK